MLHASEYFWIWLVVQFSYSGTPAACLLPWCYRFKLSDKNVSSGCKTVTLDQLGEGQAGGADR